jgi:hypothetical protein
VASRRPVNKRGSRALGIGFLILSLVHVPLPQADYHNIRHHDAPDEICVYHDHLLRWHPSANRDADVTMLHWHWYVPLVETGDHHPQDSNDDHRGPPSGPSLHAHLGNLPAPDWLGDPVVRPDTRGRFVDQLTLGQSDTSLAYLADQSLQFGPRSRNTSLDQSGAGGLRASRTALFQRWNC